MSAHPRSLSRRLGPAAAVSTIAAIALAGPASAHVTVSADDSTKAAPDSILTFRVPNEEDSATTTKVNIKFPTKNPLASVKPAAVAGWVVTSKAVKFSPPIKTDDGTITDGVGEVVYTAAPGTKGIPVGGFGAFQVLVGPLPDADRVVFSVVQTYSSGKVDSWIEPVTDPAHEPESPTPILALHSATTAGGATTATADGPTMDLSSYAKQSDVSTGRNLGLVGLIAGVLGLVLGGIALGRGRGAGAPQREGTRS